MSLGIYKQGQGYWVRVLTAAFIAVITLGAAGWMAGQTARFEANLTRTTYSLAIGTPDGSLAVGDRVTLLARPETSGSPPRVLGDARVASYDAANTELRINDIKIAAADEDASMATSVRGSAFEAAVRNTVGVPPIEPRLLMGLVVGLVLLIGAIIAYYLTAVRTGMVDFLISTDMEMKKVHWSSWKEIKGSTAVVILACVLIAGFLYTVDYSISALFRAIGILDAG